jgi:hypothetical protein
LAAAYAQLGQLDKAREEATAALRVEPWFRISQGIFATICKRPENAGAKRDFQSDYALLSQSIVLTISATVSNDEKSEKATSPQVRSSGADSIIG